MHNVETISNRRAFNLGFFVVLALIVGGILYTANAGKEQQNKLQSEVQAEYKRVSSECKSVGKEKKYQANGDKVFIEKFSCDNGVDYSFVNHRDDF